MALLTRTSRQFTASEAGKCRQNPKKEQGSHLTVRLQRRGKVGSQEEKNNIPGISEEILIALVSFAAVTTAASKRCCPAPGTFCGPSSAWQSHYRSRPLSERLTPANKPAVVAPARRRHALSEAARGKVDSTFYVTPGRSLSESGKIGAKSRSIRR